MSIYICYNIVINMSYYPQQSQQPIYIQQKTSYFFIFLIICVICYSIYKLTVFFINKFYPTIFEDTSITSTTTSTTNENKDTTTSTTYIPITTQTTYISSDSDL